MAAERVAARRTIRVFICDDVPEVRELTRLHLEAGGGIRVVGEAADGEAGLAGVAAAQPDVVILDLCLPGMDGLVALLRMKSAAPSARVVIFSGLAREHMGGIVGALGADRYVEKSEPLSALRDAVVSVGSA